MDRKESTKIFMNMTFGKITFNFIPNNVETLNFTCVLCVELVSILMPISPQELKHEIFNRSHLNSKLRLRLSFWFSPFFFIHAWLFKEYVSDSQRWNTQHSRHVLFSLCIKLPSKHLFEWICLVSKTSIILTDNSFYDILFCKISKLIFIYT